MRNISMSRLGRASTVLAIAGIGFAAMGLGVSAEAREYGYWDGWGFHHYYSSNRYYYGYNYAPGYYYAPRTYAPPAYAYSYPHYYGRWAP
jgi:hypothetical protein